MCLPPGMHVAADRSERPRCGGNEARTGGATHATIEDCTTRRVGAAKKNRRLIEAVGGKRRIRLQEGAEVPPTTLHFGRECDVEHREVGFGVFAIDDIHHFLHDVGVCSRHVVVFVEVVGQVVKSALAALDHQFPIAHADTEHISFVEFPVEGIVVLLCLVVAGEGGINGEAVVDVALVVLVGLGEVANAGHVAEGGQEIVESKLQVRDFAGLDLTGPAHDEGNTDTAFVSGTFESLEKSVAVEEGGIGSTLLVRSVVGGEDHDGVLVQALLLEFIENLSDVGVESSDHGRKLRMGNLGAVVAVAKLACELVLLAEMVLVGEEDAIFGLREFGVREGVGEDAKEGLRTALLVEPFHGLVVDEIGGVLRALGVVGLCGHAVLDVFLEDNAVRLGVACRTTEGVEEVGIVSVGLELTDVAKVFVDAALVGRGDRRFVASGPFAEHAGGVAVGFEDFGQNLVVHVIGFLSGPSVLEVGILAVEIGHALVAPIFFVATHVGVSAVLSGHECGARRCGDGATGIGLCETHAFGGHAIDARGGNVLLSVATEIAVAHVVTHDVDDVGALLRMGGEGGEGAESEEGVGFIHDMR